LPSISQTGHSRLLDTGLAAFLAAVWGFAWPATIIGLRDCDPLLLASLRNILGGVVLYLWRLRKTNKECFGGRTLWVTFIAGSCWVGIPIALTAWALQYISGGLGSILQSTTPFFVAIFAYFLLHENQFSLVKITGLVIGFGGIIVLFSDDSVFSVSNLTLLAGLAVLLPSALNGFAQVFARKHFKGQDKLGFMMYILLIAGFETLPLCFIGGLPRVTVTTDLTLSVLYLGILASAVPFVIYFELLQRVDIVILSMIAYVIPVIAVIAGIAWLGERMSGRDIQGSILVLFGVIIATQYDVVRSKLASRKIS
jgi:drug/metabolite transporter (DMT)-like permease